MSETITSTITSESIASTATAEGVFAATVTSESIVSTVSAAVAQAALPETILAAQNLSAYKAVVPDGSGGFVLASADNPEHSEIVYGITLQAITSGATGTAQTSGIVENNTWAWVPKGVIFLGANGELTQSIPAAGFALALGYALTETKMALDIGESIILS